LAPYASPTAIRTTEMGAWIPATGRTPGSAGRFERSLFRRSPDAGSHWATRRRLSSGVIVAALSPSFVRFIAAAPDARSRSSSRGGFRARGRSALSDLEADDVRRMDAQRVDQQLLPRLVAFEQDHRRWVHGPARSRRAMRPPPRPAHSEEPSQRNSDRNGSPSAQDQRGDALELEIAGILALGFALLLGIALVAPTGAPA